MKENSSVNFPSIFYINRMGVVILQLALFVALLFVFSSSVSAACIYKTICPTTCANVDPAENCAPGPCYQEEVCDTPTPVPTSAGSGCVYGCVPSSSATSCTGNGGTWVSSPASCSSGQVCGFCDQSGSGGGSNPNPTRTPTPTPSGGGGVCYSGCSADSTQIVYSCSDGASYQTCLVGCCGYNAATYSYSCGSACPGATTSPSPTRTPAPTPTSSGVSGVVFVDLDGDGVKDSGEDGMEGVVVRVQGTNGFSKTDTSSSESLGGLFSAGRYSISGIPNGSSSNPITYTISIPNPPEGYSVETVGLSDKFTITTTGSFSRTYNFGLYQEPSPKCINALTVFTPTLNPGGSTTLRISGCSNVEPSPPPGDGVLPPPYDWDPPQDDNPTNEGSPQCSDGIDNDGDGKTDEEDPSCHWDGDPDDDNDGVPDNVDPDSPDSYTPADDNESPKDTTPQCSDGLDNDGDGYRDIEDPECHSDGNPDSNNDGTPDNDDGSYTPNDDNESDRVSEGTPGNPETGSNQCSDGGLVVQSATTTGSTATWTAPQCPTQQLTCTINTTVSGPGGTYLDATDVTVRRSGQIDVEVVDVSSGGDCASAPPYTDPITLNLSGPVSTTEEITDGTYSFVCLPNGAYTVAIGLPPGYQVAAGGSFQQTTTVTNNTRSVRFCIANFEPWFQTDTGDVRMNGIVNPVPGGHLGSTGIQSGVAEPYPGVFHSTTFTAEFDEENTISPKNWVVNKEYEYNAFNKNRNGTVAYSFYKSRAKQEGVAITPLSATDFTLDATTMNQLAATGIYEVGGNLTINAYTHPPDQRITLLVAGNVTINSNIAVPPGSLFILAARGNIVVTDTVGQADPSSVSPNLEGIYSAEGSIVLSGTECTDGTTPDRRLNIAGALIANALTPFSSGGAGRLQNQRSLCSDDNNYPSLSVLTRPDFLLTLTDFYKAPYTKWREMNP